MPRNPYDPSVRSNPQYDLWRAYQSIPEQMRTNLANPRRIYTGPVTEAEQFQDRLSQRAHAAQDFEAEMGGLAEPDIDPIDLVGVPAASSAAKTVARPIARVLNHRALARELPSVGSALQREFGSPVANIQGALGRARGALDDVAFPTYATAEAEAAATGAAQQMPGTLERARRALLGKYAFDVPYTPEDAGRYPWAVVAPDERANRALLGALRGGDPGDDLRGFYRPIVEGGGWQGDVMGIARPGLTQGTPRHETTHRAAHMVRGFGKAHGQPRDEITRARHAIEETAPGFSGPERLDAQLGRVGGMFQAKGYQPTGIYRDYGPERWGEEMYSRYSAGQLPDVGSLPVVDSDATLGAFGGMADRYVHRKLRTQSAPLLPEMAGGATAGNPYHR